MQIPVRVVALRGKCRLIVCALLLAGGVPGNADDNTTNRTQADVQTLPGTQMLLLDEPLDVLMVRGINRFAERELRRSMQTRSQNWHRDYASEESYLQSVQANRERFAEIIGAIDARGDQPTLQMIISQDDFQSGIPILASSPECIVRQVRWPVMDGVTGEGLLLSPKSTEVTASVIAIPDADWSPEAMVGLSEGVDVPPFVLQCVQQGCEVLVPTLINRDHEFSGNPAVGFTNQSHREFVYRTSFEIGRHVIGYEVQKILAAVDYFALRRESQRKEGPIGVAGMGEGGLLAFYAAAMDTRIDSVMVCGYFDNREQVWREPIYRNVWSLLTEFADADIASLIAPRRLTIEACSVPEVDGPAEVTPGRRGGAAPGEIRTPEIASVRDEFALAQAHYQSLGRPGQIELVVSDGGTGPAGSNAAVTSFLTGLNLDASLKTPAKLTPHLPLADASARQARQIDELVERNQRLVRNSPRIREQHWNKADRSTVASWKESTESYRDEFYDEVIGRLPHQKLPINPRSRLMIEEEKFKVYEVVLDVFEDVIAGGLLLLPTDLKPGERRPVVVCQHGLEGTAASTLDQRKDRFLDRGFAAELAIRGFIVYAPQNPYRGGDAFREIQRKSNPLQRSLFSYIIPQHEQTLRWLSTLPYVDADRIAFYGISYGGKTAMRVPPFVPQYALSICSADFNEWIGKTTSNIYRASYVYTGEYEIWEWNMGNIASYAELACMMTPRPFMVERGHRDGVAPDEWVAAEYAKVRRHYDELGLGDSTTIEFFNGPHTIRGLGTFAFLHKHLNWPEPK
ncbi:putative secreted protein [Rhodopirellula maiorica SM1]|uniref:Putative secreted protein n=1 Tax=Rhodopirellula maiorica SM1 TaxID=1265738 RepID=M5RZX5_9BACT|nr:putative secreted protein [Rhodopirellula maiorica]EMI19474.1 putative secreted protein [Rhodopirellula maiorica SM1]